MRGRFDISLLTLSRHMVPSRVSDFPFSASAVLATRENFLPIGGGSAPGLTATPTTESLGAGPARTGQESIEEILRQRMNWRQKLLLDKGKAEFAEGNYQSAFSQFVLAGTLEGASDEDPKRLVVLCSIAAGNYSQGALQLAKLLEEDPTLFSDPDNGVDRLYENAALFKFHLMGLRGDRERDDGDGMPWLLLIYALWLDGDPQEAADIGQKLIDHTVDPVFMGLTKRLVAGVSGRPLDITKDAKPVWPVGG